MKQFFDWWKRFKSDVKNARWAPILDPEDIDKLEQQKRIDRLKPPCK